MDTKSLLRKTALTYGVYLGLISIALSAIQYLVGAYDISGQGEGRWLMILISLAATTVIVVMAAKKFKTDGDGFMSFGEGFKLAFSTIIYSTLIMLVWLALYMWVLEPGYQEEILTATHENMINSGADPGTDGYEMGMSWTEKMTQPLFMLVITIVQSAIFGAILALIFAAFLQKKRDPFASQAIDNE